MPSARATLVLVVTLFVVTADLPRLAAAEDPAAAFDAISKIRSEFKQIDLKAVADYVADVKSESNDELLKDRAEIARIRGFVMKKWKEYQRLRWRFFGLLSNEVRAVRATLVLASLDLERKERGERIEAREAQEYVDTYKESYYGKHKQHIAEWNSSAARKRYDDEYKRLGDWYVWAVKQEVERVKAGKTAADDLLDQIAAECQHEIAALTDARLTVQVEIWNRGLEPYPEDYEAKPLPHELAEQQRDDFRLAPLKTEYEAQVSEPVEIFFQAWKGVKPYSWMVTGKVMEQLSWLTWGKLQEPGVGSFLVTFTTPGTHHIKLRVTDGERTSKELEYDVKVTGAPLPPPTLQQPVPPPGADPKGGSGAGSTSATPPVPIAGTFDAVLFGGTLGLERPDVQPKVGPHRKLPLTPVPITVTISPSGAITGKADYSLPASAMGAPMKEGGTNLVWQTRLELTGTVDWTTGRTHLDIKGHDESGLEQDVDGYGHWRQRSKADYTVSLDGFSIPGPDATRWRSTTGAAAGAFGPDLEMLGRPALTAGSAPDFAHGGFFGDGPGTRKFSVSAYMLHTGYDGKDESDEDQTRIAQSTANLIANMGIFGWHLRIGGPPAPPSQPPPSVDATPAGRGDLWGFGVWPERPIEAGKGEVVRATAMGVFSGDPLSAENLSSKATWTPSPGLVALGDGTFKADAPGTYTLTATVAGPNGPMTSTTTVVVK